ncbi:MAG: hypothetical protein H8D96_14565 [Desulfobacterales bacterium]|uniref:Uncharacterized protein n=1 Tax=Candidatus Desulfatibia vada TaxID=2841696 RepID=A0A8J6P2C7_9BACT|nr:hypothetical protein [Candidatus Desulfatibia vada]MBL6971703.1 hypothetical protein [Desulfobacterales bacterium]
MTETTTIRGIVIPVAWDEKGDVISVAIATYQEEKYLVADSSTGRRLISLLKKSVAVEGVIKDEDTDKIIYAKTIRIDQYGTQDTGRKTNQINGK